MTTTQVSLPDRGRFFDHIAAEVVRARLAAEDLRLDGDPDAVLTCGAEIVLSLRAVRAFAALLGHRDPDTATPRWLAARLPSASGARATGTALWLHYRAVDDLRDRLYTATIPAENTGTAP